MIDEPQKPTGDFQRIDGPRSHRGRRALKLGLLFTWCVGLALMAFFDSRVRALTSVDAPALAPTGLDTTESPAQTGDFSQFTHNNPQHARLPCLLCHRRDDDPVRPRLPGHMPCAGCHSQQFANNASPICTICHTDPASGAVKPFP
ncbi:MAG TPA: hypothetical protein VEV81_13685, partial [Pyrinomonadaceae bacterium]|nr:hypothetical protein [Pyrinomonadaceae bacterium]